MAALFDQIGGDRLRAVITDFYRRVFADVMIGFLFDGKDMQRLIDKEWEFTAQLLGGEVRYSGRPIREAHAASPILGGHFERRYKILEETLADHGVPEAVRAAWLGHTRSLRAQVTGDDGTECDHDKVPH
jgi:hemoglobin